jgi:hypothetical protein
LFGRRCPFDVKEPSLSEQLKSPNAGESFKKVTATQVTRRALFGGAGALSLAALLAAC